MFKIRVLVVRRLQYQRELVDQLIITLRGIPPSIQRGRRTAQHQRNAFVRRPLDRHIAGMAHVAQTICRTTNVTGIFAGKGKANARNVLGITDASSTEFTNKCTNVI